MSNTVSETALKIWIYLLNLKGVIQAPNIRGLSDLGADSSWSEYSSESNNLLPIVQIYVKFNETHLERYTVATSADIWVIILDSSA